MKSTKCLSIVGTEDNAGGWLAGEEERKRLTGSMIESVRLQDGSSWV